MVSSEGPTNPAKRGDILAYVFKFWKSIYLNSCDLNS